MVVARRSATKVRRGGFFVPLSTYEPKHKVELTFEGDASASDVSNKMINFSITGQKNRLKTASVRFRNEIGYWVNKLSGGELIEIYTDFVDGTTKRFSGKIEEKYFALSQSDGWTLTVRATQIPELRDKTFSQSFDAVAGEVIIKDIIDNHYSGSVTYANVATISTLITKSFTSSTGVRAIEDICKLAGYTFYIDETNDLHVIEEESEYNQSENISYGVNLLSCNRVGSNFKTVKNRVLVYGKNLGNNVLYLKSSSDTDSQDDLWIKDLVKRDSTIESNADASDTAEANILTSTSQEGSVVVAGGIPTINAGEQIRVSLPYTELMDWAVIESYTHTFSQGRGLITNVKLSRQVDLAEIQRDNEEVIASSYTGTNPNGMSEGLVLSFDDESHVESRSNTQITDGQLSLTSGASTGNLITINQSADTSFTRASYVLDGENLDNCTVDISTDNRETWTLLSAEGTTSISGESYIFRLNLTQISATVRPLIRSFGGYVG